jgi:hypothetical protein
LGGRTAAEIEDEAVLGTGDRPAHEQHVALGIRADDLEILMGRAIDAVVARPARAAGVWPAFVSPFEPG